MKQIFTLTAFLTIVTLISYGQISVFEKIGKFSVEQKVYELKQHAIQQGQFQVFLNSRNLNDLGILNSVQAGTQKLDSYVTYDWNKKKNQWINSTKSEFSYESSNATVRNTQYTEFEWDTIANMWQTYGIAYYSYEANGDMVQTMDTEWDGGTDPWTADFKNVFSFNTNGTVKTMLSYMISETTKDWYTFMKTEFTYDSNGKKTQDNSSILLDEESTDWFAYSKVDYSYNDKGDLKEELEYSLDFTTFQMELSGKTEYAYDGNARLIQIVESEKDPLTKIIKMAWKSDFTIDANGNIGTEIYSEWDETSDSWKVDSKDEYQYNNSYSFSDLIMPVNLDEQNRYLNHMLTGFTEYNWNSASSEWDLDSKFVFNYSDKNTTNILELNSDILRVYPNPTTDFILINLADNFDVINFELFDLQGRKIWTEQITGDRRINLSAYSSGVYFYRVNAKGATQSGKLIKQ